MKEPRRHKSDGQDPWQQIKHVNLNSSSLHGCKKKQQQQKKNNNNRESLIWSLSIRDLDFCVSDTQSRVMVIEMATKNARKETI